MISTVLYNHYHHHLDSNNWSDLSPLNQWARTKVIFQAEKIGSHEDKKIGVSRHFHHYHYHQPCSNCQHEHDQYYVDIRAQWGNVEKDLLQDVESFLTLSPSSVCITIIATKGPFLH